MMETLSFERAGRSEQNTTARVRLRSGLGDVLALAFHKLRLPGLVAFAAASALTLANLSAADSATSSNELGETLLGEKGDLDHIEFEGVATFNREALRNALAQNAGFLLASHPQAPLGPFLETLRQKILTGYQQNGFPKANVTATLDSATSRVRVRVTEGARYRCGKVQVTGVKPALAAAILARLTQPALPPSKTSEMAQSAAENAVAADNAPEKAKARVQTEAHLNIERRDPRQALAATRKPSDDQPLWAPGEPGAFGEAAAKQIDEAVKDCLAEHGLFFPKTSSTAKLNLQNSTSDLLVQVLDEGPLDNVVTNLPPVQRQRAVAAVNQLLSTTVLAPIDEAMGTTNQAEPFTIPADEIDRALAQNSFSALLAAFGFRYCNEFFPKYSWPWTIARESVFLLANQAAYADAELQRLYESQDTGPAGCLVIAELLAKLNSPAAKTFAARGLTRLSAADFQRDCRLFLQGESRLARAFSNLAVALREMPSEDLDALAAALPADEAALLKDCGQALRSAPTEPLAATLGPALDQYWAKSLRAQVQAALQKLSVSAPTPATPRI